MDSFELNKIMGAILGTLLFVLSLSIVTGGIFASHPPAKPGYEIAAKDDKAGTQQAAAEPQVPLEKCLAIGVVPSCPTLGVETNCTGHASFDGSRTSLSSRTSMKGPE